MQDTNGADLTTGQSWHDITSEFKGLVGKLDLGELIKPESFTLLEAMSAIELMDPKMDSGMILSKTTREILSFDQAIKSMKVKIVNLELPELLGIIDDTYACIATWLDGHSISQTIMTNLYLHDTEKIEDRCLRVYCQSALKLVEIMDRMVGLVYCIEEEDFVLNSNKFKLAYHLSDQKVLNALGELCLLYEKSYNDIDKAGATNCSKQKMTNPSNRQQQQQPSQDLGISFDKSHKSSLEGLITRLKFTHSLLSCFININKSLLKDRIVITTDHSIQVQAQRITKSVYATTSSCDENLEGCLRLLVKWKETIDLGLQPTTKEDGHLEGDYPTIMGFDPLINYKLLPPAYPRCMTIKSRPDTLDYLKNLLVKLRRCIAISNEFNQSRSFIKRVEAVENFTKYFAPKSCVISRSFLQKLYVPIRATPLLKEEILQSMVDFCEPAVESLRSNEAKFMALDEFLEESAKLFFQIVTTYGHNPARQYEKFTEIIQSFRNLQYSSFLLSEALDSMMTYSWTTYYFMKFCIKYVLSGLELELFSPHEYPYVFWYLDEVLLRNEREQLEMGKKLALSTCEKAMTNEISANNKTNSVHNNGKQNSKRTKTKVKKKLSKLDNMVELFHDRNLLLNEALGDLTHGLFLLTFALKKQGIIKMPSFEFTNEGICFEHRFNLITGGSSVYNSYLQFTSSFLLCEQPKVIYREASARFSKAKKLFERCENQENCLAVSRANDIVANILYMNPDAFANRQVEFCFDKHPSLPIIKF